MITDEYITISAPAEGMYKDRGSIFYAFAIPIADQDAIKSVIKQIKKTHHECNHHCYAFRLGPKGQTFRSSNDREPAGSAGKPILGQLLSHNLTDILIVVARYFGGTQLGIPGLINAYKQAANAAIDKSEKIIKTENQTFQLTIDYQYLNELLNVLRSEPVQIIQENYNTPAVLDIMIRKSRESALLEKIKNNHLLGAHLFIKQTT